MQLEQCNQYKQLETQFDVIIILFDCWLYHEESSNGTNCLKSRSSRFREDLQEVTTLQKRYWCMALNPRLEDMF